MKTTNVRKTKPDETKALFRSPFMPSSLEMIGPIVLPAWDSTTGEQLTDVCILHTLKAHKLLNALHINITSTWHISMY